MLRGRRQPVYLGFAATLWTARCIAGPRLEEGRSLRRHGEAFRRHQSAVPYMAPRLRRAA